MMDSIYADMVSFRARKNAIKGFSCVLSVFLAVLMILQTFPVDASAYADAFLSDSDGKEISGAVEDVQILSEITEERTADTKTFLQSDGTHLIAMYPYDVHYENPYGEFIEYNNTLSQTEGENAELYPHASDVDIRISKKTNGKKLVRMSKDGYELSWSFADLNKTEGTVTAREDDGDKTTLEGTVSEVLFSDAFTDADIQYILCGNIIKENIIIKSGNAPSEFVIEYKMNGLSARLSEDKKTIYFEDGENNTIFEITAPIMTDAGADENSSLYYEIIESKNNHLKVKLIADKSWLTDKSRKYPITIDPVILTESRWYNGNWQSAYVDSANPARCYGKGSVTGNYEGSLYVGKIGGRGSARSYISFELPSLKNGDKVVDARLYMYLSDTDSVTVEMHRVIEDWQENTITWNSDIDYDASVIDYKDFDDIDGNEYVDWDITETVHGWYMGNYTNYGLVLYSSSETVANEAYSRFYSSGYVNYEGYSPILTISVRNMAGVEDYYLYTTLGAGRSGSISVNNFNGNIVSDHPITLDNGGTRMPVSISAVFNSSNAGYGENWLGDGWQLNYNLFVKPNPYITSSSTETERKYRYFYSDSDGTKHYFYFENTSDTEGKDEDGLGYTLKLNSASSPTEYTITDKTGNTMVFDSKGNITSINDKVGNSVTVTYETITNNGTEYTRVKNIKDGAERVYTFTYNSASSVVLKSITDPAGRSTSFSMSDNGISSITYPDGKTVSFTYLAARKLSQITSPDGTSVSISYDSDAASLMVQSITEKYGSAANETYSFEYNQNETVITDRQGREYTYQFNNFGQPTGVVSDTDKSAIAMTYSAGNTVSANANKLLSSSRVQQSVNNYVKNPSFNSADLNSYDVWYSSSSDTSIAEKDQNYGHYAKGSMKITRPSGNSGSMVAYQRINVPSGTYTISAFVSTNGGTLSTATGVFGAELGYVSSGSIYKSYFTEKIQSTAAGKWERRSITIEVPEGSFLKVICGFKGAVSGTVWIDDIQVEEGHGVSSFNIIQNPSFFNDTWMWSIFAPSNSVTASTLNGFTKQMTLTPVSDEVCYVCQNVPFNGKKGDVFSTGAWIKADSVSLDTQKNISGTAKNAECKLKIELINYGEIIKSEEQQYNPNVEGWQFVSTEILADAPFTNVRVNIVYDYNCNSISTTGIYVLAEEYGQSYTYDNNGNLISSADVSGSMDSYGFAANNLGISTSPTGSSVILSTYESDNLLHYAQTTDGQRYDYKYDTYGNATDLKIGASKIATSISNGKMYYLLNAASGYALNASGNTSGADCNMQNFKASDNYQIWVAVANSDGTYSFQSKKNTALNLDISDGSSADGAVVQVYTASSNNAQKFNCQLQSDGTFIITSVCSNGACAINGKPGEEVKNGTPVVQSTLEETNSKSNRWYLVPGNAKFDYETYLNATATYTTDGNFLASDTSVDGITQNYTYNTSSGQLTSTTLDSVTTNYTYVSNSNQLASVTTDGASVGYTYTNDRLTKIDTAETDYAFTFDSFGRNTKVKAGQYTLSTSTYNSDGLLSSQSYLGGDTKEYVYDSLDRVTEEKYNSDRLKYYYGSDGFLSYVTDSKTDTRTQYEYDLADRVVSVKEFNGTDTYLFDLNSSLRYTYVDGKNQISSVSAKTDLGENSVTVSYGNISSGQMPDVVYSEWWNDTFKRSYTYDTLGRVKTVNTNSASGMLTGTYTYKTISGKRSSSLVSSLATPAGTFSYTYDAKGNIASVSDGTYLTTYTYDSLNQLVREDNEKLGKTYTYSYLNGNITSRKEYAYTTGDVGTATAIKTDTYEYSAYAWGDLLVKAQGKSLTYTDGEITKLNGKNLTWGFLGKLTSCGDTSFTYDTSGRRLSKTTGSTVTEYYYAGDMLVGQKTGSDKLEFMFDSGGDYYGFEYNDTPYYYIKNLQGDVVAIFNDSGTQVATYTYDAWGRILATTDTSGINIATINPIRYRSYYYDSETGFYYLNARYYYPEICRFISPDKFLNNKAVNTQNLFVYCLNNPVNMADTSGELPFLLVTAAIGAAAGAIIGGVVAAKTGGNVWAGIGIGAAAGGLAGAGLGAAAGVMLAGCATASTAAVASGAGMLATAVSTCGAGAGFALVEDNISRAVNNVGTVLYSGGDQARQAATTFINNNGGTTIDPTVIGQVADAATNVPGADFTTVWSQASSAFCHQASGVVNAFVSNSAYRGVDSIFWSVEMPTLLNNPRVTEIIIHILE